MNKPLDLTGQCFGRLTVTGRAPNNARGGTMWECLCSCGTTKPFWSANLLRGKSLSCGCIRAEQLAARNSMTKRTHAMSKTSEYRIWSGMLTRCTNPRAEDFQHYGGRGIAVCERWMRFENFIEDMGPRPSSSHSVDRIDNDKGYEPENCYWATNEQQHRNRRVSIWIEHDGLRLTLKEWSKRTGVHYETLFSRYKKGLTGHDLLRRAKVVKI